MKKITFPVLLSCNLILAAGCTSYKPLRLGFELPQGRIRYSSGEQQALSSTQRPRCYEQRWLVFPSGSEPVAVLTSKAAESMRRGEFSEARILLEEALKEEPDNIPALNNAGVLIELSGDWKKAADYYARCALAFPDNQYYRENFLQVKDRAK